MVNFRPIFFWRQNCCIHSSSPSLPPPVLKISFIGYLHILPQRKEKFHFRLTLTTKIFKKCRTELWVCGTHRTFGGGLAPYSQTVGSILRPPRLANASWENYLSREYYRGKHCGTVDLLFDWFGVSCMTTVFICFYLQNRLIQTSQTGGQWYSDTSPFSIPWSEHSSNDNL